MLWVITGSWGTGKTLLATYLSALCSTKEPVYSNYKIKLKNCGLIDAETLSKMQYEKALIVLDEAYTWLECRLSESDLNKYMSYIMFQSRKRGFDFILTAQLRMTLDVRFRLMADVNVLSSRTPKSFDYIFIKDTGQHSAWSLEQSWCEKTLYNKYDTLQIISPFDFASMTAKVGLLTNPEQSNKMINDIVVSALPDFEDVNPNKIGHSAIYNFMLEKGFPQSLEPFVYARLKQRLQNSKNQYKKK